MNECPTLVRMGLPPCSRTTSGTALDVIRLWTTDDPGARASSRTAIRAVSVEGLTGSPRSSTTKHRSASPSNASPRSAPCSITVAWRSRRLAGSIGLASWLGNEPSSSKYSRTTVRPATSSTDGTVCPAMPFAASTTTVSGRMPERSTRPRRYAPYSASTSRYSTTPGGSATSNEPISASSRTCASPVSCPTGAAPARQSLIPLYWAGLWLAVNMAPGSPSRPLAKYSWSVDASPMWMTSAPREVTPSANAADSGSEDGRMSCPTTTAPGPSRTSTNAAPTSRAIPSCSSSGTTPRMSYAFTMPARSRTAEPYRRMEPSALGAGQHAQVAPAADLVHAGGVRGLGAGGLAHRVGEREQVVTARPDARRIRSEPDDLPAPWRHESLGMLRTQVVAVWFGVGGQWPEDRGRVCVHVGERRDRRTAARRPGAATPGAHDPNVSATRPRLRIRHATPWKRGRDGAG